MYRVLFRIIKIHIHIKERISLEVVFKKGTQNIIAKEFYQLVDGIAHVNLTTEFLIIKTNPVFELHINFTFQKIKKQAGFIQLNLHDWSINQSYQQIRTLQNSPGGKAFIQFGFIYFDFGKKCLMKQIESLEEFEESTNEEYRSQIERQNYILSQNLRRLKNEKHQLTQENSNLSRMEAEYSQIEATLSQQISNKQKKMKESQDSLKVQEQKSLFLMELVEKSGSQSLIKSIQKLAQFSIQNSEYKNCYDLQKDQSG